MVYISDSFFFCSCSCRLSGFSLSANRYQRHSNVLYASPLILYTDFLPILHLICSFAIRVSNPFTHRKPDYNATSLYLPTIATLAFYPRNKQLQLWKNARRISVVRIHRRYPLPNYRRQESR